MKQKPAECNGCPLFYSGQGFVPDLFVRGSEVLQISMYPDTMEQKTGTPGEGMFSDQYYRAYAKYAGQVEVSQAHVIRCRGQIGTKLPTGKAQKDAVAFCRVHDRIPTTAKLIVYRGEDVKRHLRPDVKGEWRGFILGSKGGFEVDKEG